MLHYINPVPASPCMHHAVGQVDGQFGEWGVVKSAMGAITQAMAKSATDKAVVIFGMNQLQVGHMVA